MADESDEIGTAADFYNQMFDARYKKNRVGRKEDVFYADGSDGLANLKKLYLSFQHVGSQKAYISKPLLQLLMKHTLQTGTRRLFLVVVIRYTFTQTTKQIQLSFVIPAASESEAFENLGKVQSLSQFLYPNYHNVQQAQTIAQGPLVRLKVMNMLQNMADSTVSDGGGQANFRNLKNKSTYYKDYKSKGLSPGFGQLGFIQSLTVNHSLENRESGVFEKLDPDTNQTVQNTILPKVIEVVVSFTPIHEHALGWDNNGTSQKKCTHMECLFTTRVKTILMQRVKHGRKRCNLKKIEPNLNKHDKLLKHDIRECLAKVYLVLEAAVWPEINVD